MKVGTKSPSHRRSSFLKGQEGYRTSTEALRKESLGSKVRSFVLRVFHRRRCLRCQRRTCKCWATNRGDGVCERLMDTAREPVVVPGGGSSCNFSRPVKCLFEGANEGGFSCSRRLASCRPSPGEALSRPTVLFNAHRTRSGSVPPSGEGGYRRAGLGRGHQPLSGGDGSPSRTLQGENYSRGVRRSSGTSRGDCAGDMVSVPCGGRPQQEAARSCVLAQLDLVQLDCSGGGSGYNSQTCSEEEEDNEPCQILLEERLVKTNPIWFLPDLQRAGAVHLLQGKEEGIFIVRQSSKSDTLAISVRLPPDKGPHIQHYLVEIHDQGTKYSLEDSTHHFPNLPALIAHYASCCDELPVQLKLPRCVQEAKTRHELASIALLGQEFWGTHMASPYSNLMGTEDRPALTSSPKQSDLSFTSFGKSGISRGSSHANLLSPKTPTSTHLSGSTSSLTPLRPSPPLSNADRTSLNLNLFSQNELLCEQPVLSSFKSQSNTPVTPIKPTPPPRTSPPSLQNKIFKPAVPSRSSPPSSTRQIVSGSDAGETSCAPVPPQRWVKPPYTTSCSPSSNITVTTTLTFNVSHAQSNTHADEMVHLQDDGLQKVEEVNNREQAFHVQVSSLEITPPSALSGSVINGILTGAGVMNRHREALNLQIRQSVSPQSTPCTPAAPTATPLGTPLSEDGDARVRLRKSKKDKHRLSNHYHEANILDSMYYCHSSVADKVSDYEDLWTSPKEESQEPQSSQDTSMEVACPHEQKPNMSTFKPNSEISKSLGDLSDINQSHKPVLLSYDFNKENEILHSDKLVVSSPESLDFSRKTASPFYVEPADALKEYEQNARIKKASGSRLSRKVANRFSDSNIQWKSRRRNMMEKIYSKESLNGLSSSLEDITNDARIERKKNAVNAGHLKSTNHTNHSRMSSRAKPVPPPRIEIPHTKVDHPWRVDSSWEYVNCGEFEEDMEALCDRRFPVGYRNGECDCAMIPGDKTVQSLITEKLPNLTMPDFQDATSVAPSCVTRISEYDNVGSNNVNGFFSDRMSVKVSGEEGHRDSSHFEDDFDNNYEPSTVSDSGTEFSEPWDSRKWETLLNTQEESSHGHSPVNQQPVADSDVIGGVTDSESLVQVTGESGAVSEDDVTSLSGAPTLSLSQGQQMDTNTRSRILSPQMLALRHRQDAESGEAICTYALNLGEDQSTTFSQAISNFIICTLESQEKDPAIIVRNVRQFMSGLKNYLVTSGEREFEAIVKRERSNLKATEFLNLDAILEDVVVRLVLRPLCTHINNLYVDAYTANGSIQTLATNMKYAKAQPCNKLGIRPELTPPGGRILQSIQGLLNKMQKVYAPREKLAHLLGTVSHIYHAMYQNGVTATGDADDLVPMIMWVLCHVGIVSAEVEADYMSGLLLRSSASGEASYYLNAFHSAIHTLKNLSPSPESSPGNDLEVTKQEAALIAEQGVLKIIVPDEKNGSILTRTLPIRPGSTTKDICKMMAHKMKVTNPQDYGLYKLVDGEESQLGDQECPHKIRTDLRNKGCLCVIAFKRIDAKIAWPMVQQ